MIGNNLSGAENTQGSPNSFALWLSGFVDGEGCFSVSVHRNDTLKLGWQPFPEFAISQSINDIVLLRRIKDFFLCGKVVVNKRSDNHHSDMCKYSVKDIKSLSTIIIPFFNNYTLKTRKRFEFMRFCEILKLIKEKEHLRLSGLEKIARITQEMNTRKRSRFLDYLQRLNTNPV